MFRFVLRLMLIVCMALFASSAQACNGNGFVGGNQFGNSAFGFNSGFGFNQFAVAPQFGFNSFGNSAFVPQFVGFNSFGNRGFINPRFGFNNFGGRGLVQSNFSGRVGIQGRRGGFFPLRPNGRPTLLPRRF